MNAGSVEIFGTRSAVGVNRRRERLGSKDMQLAELADLGLPVPPGFTITTDVCRHYLAHDRCFPDGFCEEIMRGLAHIERATGKRFGSASDPLLISVRLSCPADIPSSFGAVLNVGLNDETIRGLASAGGSSFAWSSYSRLIAGYADAVVDLDQDRFDEALLVRMEQAGVKEDLLLKAGDWEQLTAEYCALVLEGSGKAFPQDCHEQLLGSIASAFNGTQSLGAQTYRALHRILDDLGVAVVVQAMVFPNIDNSSGTGVLFTRDPSTGDKAVAGEYLIAGLGDDVISGVRTPLGLTEHRYTADGAGLPSMRDAFPGSYAELSRILTQLEAFYRDMLDVAFCVEGGKVWLLSCRPGKRSPRAAVKIAVDLAREGAISEGEAVSRVEAAALQAQLIGRMNDSAALHPLATGLPASPGAVAGMIVFDPDTAKRKSSAGHSVILVCIELDRDTRDGIDVYNGIVSSRGGMTSHASVVARGRGFPCISGAAAIRIDRAERLMRVGGKIFQEGDVITIDGTLGLVAEGNAVSPSMTVSPETRLLIAMTDRLNGACAALAGNAHDAVIAKALLRSKICVSTASAVKGHLKDFIIELTRAGCPSHLTVFMDGLCSEEKTIVSARHHRNSIALNPVAFHDVLSAVVAGFVAATRDSGPVKLNIAISGVMHANDVSACRTMLDKITSALSLNDVELVGVIDSPYALLCADRLFAPLSSLLLDMEKIADNLFLQSPESIAAYQNLGELDVPEAHGGVFRDVLNLLASPGLQRWREDHDGHIGAILPSACNGSTWRSLRNAGVSALAYPVSALSAALTNLLDNCFSHDRGRPG